MTALVVPGVRVEARFDVVPPPPSPSGILGLVGVVDRRPEGLVGLTSTAEIAEVLGPGTVWSMPELADALRNGASEVVVSAVVDAEAGTGRLRLRDRDDQEVVELRARAAGPWADAVEVRVDEVLGAEDGAVVRADLERNLEGWDANDGHTLWSKRNEHAVVVDKLVALDGAAPEITLLDASGNELGRVRAGHPRIEALAADGSTIFIASSDASEYGGVTRDFVEGFDVHTGARVLETRLEHVVRRYASEPPELWAPSGGLLYFFEIDNGLLSTIDRNGRVLSSMGVAGRAVIRTPTGFAAIDEAGVVEILEPSDTESPPSAKATVEGTLSLDGKPMAGIEIVVGDVRTTSGAGGRYSASVTARGHFWVKAKQPTASNNIAAWADADRLVEADGRTGRYLVNLDAKRDTLE